MRNLAERPIQSWPNDRALSVICVPQARVQLTPLLLETNAWRSDTIRVSHTTSVQ
jgi:hypothetical protein